VFGLAAAWGRGLLGLTSGPRVFDPDLDPLSCLGFLLICLAMVLWFLIESCLVPFWLTSRCFLRRLGILGLHELIGLVLVVPCMVILRHKLARLCAHCGCTLLFGQII